MPYKRWDFENPVEKNTNLVAVYDCSPDWGSITYLDGGQEKTYEFKDEVDFNVLYSPSYSTTTDFKFYDVTVARNNVKKIVVGKNVVAIGNNFAVQCKSLTELELPRSLVSIGNWFLYYASSFNSPIVFSDTLTKIGDSFLRACSVFDQPITLPSNIDGVGDYFLSGCSKFNSKVTIENNSLKIGSYFLDSCYAFNTEIILPSEWVSIPDRFLSDCQKFNQDIIIPDGVTTIGHSFLFDCYVFNRPILLPPNLKVIGSHFLYKCRAFNYPIELPASVVSLGGYYLYGCEVYNYPVEIPKSMTTIPDCFLGNMRAFNQPLELHEGITAIGFGFLGRIETDTGDAGSYNQPIHFPTTLKTIGVGLLSGQSKFNHPLEFPDGLEYFYGDRLLANGNSFNQPLDLAKMRFSDSSGMYGFACDWFSYDQDIVIPNTITTLSQTSNTWGVSFTNLLSMKHNIYLPASLATPRVSSSNRSFLSCTLSNPEYYNGVGFDGILVIDNTTAPTTSNYNYALSYQYEQAFLKAPAIKLAGPGAAAWKAAFPDRDSAPFRKLVIVDDPRTT